MKDHEIAIFTNDLRDIALRFHNHQSLRERVLGRVLEAVKLNDTEKQSDYLRDLIVRDITEGLVTPEVEDAVNVCYDYLYTSITKTLETAQITS